jgi:hypothetical protein
VRLYLRIPAVAVILAFPASLAIFLSDTAEMSIAFMGLPIFLALMNSGASNSLVQRLAQVRMRALAASILLFIINMVGLGLGPQVIGLLSDWLRPEYGDESLRHALMIGSVVYVWAGIHYLLGAKYLQADLHAVEGSIS